MPQAVTMADPGRLSQPGDALEEGSPFATVTLARLYLQQGHRERARRMLVALRRQGAPGLEELERALGEDASASPEALLQQLLDRVRERRRGG